MQNMNSKDTLDQERCLVKIPIPCARLVSCIVSLMGGKGVARKHRLILYNHIEDAINASHELPVDPKNIPEARKDELKKNIKAISKNFERNLEILNLNKLLIILLLNKKKN